MSTPVRFVSLKRPLGDDCRQPSLRRSRWRRSSSFDVHKARVTACARVPAEGGGRDRHVAEFPTTVAGLLTLRDWLAAHRPHADGPPGAAATSASAAPGDAASVGFELLEAAGVETAQARDAVGPPAALELVERGELGAVAVDDHLSLGARRAGRGANRTGGIDRAPSKHSRALSEPGA